MQAIETDYNGYRFRSRLEARWAVFFDALRIRYQYEKEGFNLDGLWYLPDFYLPDHDYWIEIKPNEPDNESEDWKKVTGLATHLGKDVYIAVGDVWMPYDGDPGRYLDRGVCNYHRPVHPGGNPASHSWWYECPQCSRLSLTVFGHHNRRACSCEGGEHLQFSDTPRLVVAYRAARQARFEHGHRPID
jgi:hypothetical protein